MKYSHPSEILIVIGVLVARLGVAIGNLHAETPGGWNYDPVNNPACGGDEKSKCGVKNWNRVTVPTATNMCASKSQSPINIATSLVANTVTTLLGGVNTLLSGASKDLVLSSTVLCNAWDQYIDGHGLTVSFAEPLKTSQCDTLKATYLGTQFTMKNMHIHSPSEHTINGKQYGAEVHMVHKDANGGILVLGVFLNIVASTPTNLRGSGHSLLTTFFNKAATAAGHITPLANDLLQDVEVNDITGINPYTKLIGNNKNYYTYSGSLTVYPCTEAVRWIVFEQPIDITSEDLALIRDATALYPDTIIYNGNNNRPIQPLNGRTVTYKTATMTN